MQSTMSVQEVSDLRSTLLVDKHAEYIASFEKVVSRQTHHRKSSDTQLSALVLHNLSPWCNSAMLAG